MGSAALTAPPRNWAADQRARAGQATAPWVAAARMRAKAARVTAGVAPEAACNAARATTISAAVGPRDLPSSARKRAMRAKDPRRGGRGWRRRGRGWRARGMCITDPPEGSRGQQKSHVLLTGVACSRHSPSGRWRCGATQRPRAYPGALRRHPRLSMPAPARGECRDWRCFSTVGSWQGGVGASRGARAGCAALVNALPSTAPGAAGTPWQIPSRAALTVALRPAGGHPRSRDCQEPGLGRRRCATAHPPPLVVGKARAIAIRTPRRWPAEWRDQAGRRLPGRSAGLARHAGPPRNTGGSSKIREAITCPGTRSARRCGVPRRRVQAAP